MRTRHARGSESLARESESVTRARAEGFSTTDRQSVNSSRRYRSALQSRILGSVSDKVVVSRCGIDAVVGQGSATFETTICFCGSGCEGVAYRDSFPARAHCTETGRDSRSPRSLQAAPRSSKSLRRILQSRLA